LPICPCPKNDTSARRVSGVKKPFIIGKEPAGAGKKSERKKLESVMFRPKRDFFKEEKKVGPRMVMDIGKGVEVWVDMRAVGDDDAPSETGRYRQIEVDCSTSRKTQKKRIW